MRFAPVRFRPTRAADLAAAIRGAPKEDLLSDELRQQRRALRTASGAAAGLAVAAGWEAYVANVERNRVTARLRFARCAIGGGAAGCSGAGRR